MGNREIRITLNEFVGFMRGDKISAHIATILEQVVDEKEKNNGASKSPFHQRPQNQKSISYKLEEKGTLVEIPIASDQNDVLIHTKNRENEDITIVLKYDSKGKIITKDIKNHAIEEGKRIIRKFEKRLKPYTSGNSESMPKKENLDTTGRYQAREKHTINRTLQEIAIVQNWWKEIERRAECRDSVPFKVAAEFLVEKNVAQNREKVKTLFGLSIRDVKKEIDYDDFKELFFKGIFRNAIKNIYTDVKGHYGYKSSHLPECFQISAYKKGLLMKALDRDSQLTKQEIPILASLQKFQKKEENFRLAQQRAKKCEAGVSTGENTSLSIDLTINASAKNNITEAQDRYGYSMSEMSKYNREVIQKNIRRPGPIALTSLRKRSEYHSLLQQHKKAVSVAPEENQLLVLNGI